METGRRLVAILNREIKTGIVEKETFDQRLKGGMVDSQNEGYVGKDYSRQ